MAGFELATPCTPCKCATRLRYIPKPLILTQSKEGSALGDRSEAKFIALILTGSIMAAEFRGISVQQALYSLSPSQCGSLALGLRFRVGFGDGSWAVQPKGRKWAQLMV